MPPNGYVTLDCEYILIFRKGRTRKFPPKDEARYASAFTKAERDKWFSQIWDDLRGTKQNHTALARRTGAYPEELVRRLIQMFSVKAEMVLDPFVGTGTTMKVAKELERNSIGYEIDQNLCRIAIQRMDQLTLSSSFEIIKQRPVSLSLA